MCCILINAVTIENHHPWVISIAEIIFMCVCVLLASERVLSYKSTDVAFVTTLVARFMGPTWGPAGANKTQVVPMLSPWTLLSENIQYLSASASNKHRLVTFYEILGAQSNVITIWSFAQSDASKRQLTMPSLAQPNRCQTIIYANAILLLIGPRGTNYSGILIKLPTFLFKRIRFNVSSGKWRSFCLGVNSIKVYNLQFVYRGKLRKY